MVLLLSRALVKGAGHPVQAADRARGQLWWLAAPGVSFTPASYAMSSFPCLPGSGAPGVAGARVSRGRQGPCSLRRFLQPTSASLDTHAPSPPLFRLQPRATLGSSSGLVASALTWLPFCHGSPLPELTGHVCSDTQRHQDWVPSDRDVLCPELGRELGAWLFPSDCRRTVGRMKEPQTSR